ncbi:YbjN domain-containing protein [Methylomonas koyamae]|uniref:YbjN domain-containing protein n=1 Tax=Methylomonas koyamae TaxID=702114 RepID=UPI0006D22DA9|nr:YbjN domain-containing protein [Methylomonas koyamae]BBL60951.1 hypothetical protein MKFW12EY_45640 [Methylomonas koyamae]
MNTAITIAEFANTEQQLISAVEQYIEAQGWRKERQDYDDGRIVFRLTFKMRNASFRTFFDLMPNQQRFAVYCYSPVDIPAEARQQVADFMARVNYRLYLGKLGLDMDEGTVRYSCTVSVEGSLLSPDMIALIENAAICGMDDHFPILMSIVHGGKTAKQAFDDMLSEDERPGDEDTGMTVH